MSLEAQLRQYVNSTGAFGSRGYEGLSFRCRQLFREAGELRGKRVLEIGGGESLFMLWALAQGAESAVNVEPVAAGSFSNAATRSAHHIEALGWKDQRFLFVPATFQEFEEQDESFDVILSYSSINHLDEPACMALLDSEEARTVYRGLFAKMRRLLRPQGLIVLQDAGRKNLWNQLGLRNPMSPSIEWDKHQEPETWARLLSESGLTPVRSEWLESAKLGSLASLSFIARATLSQFVLTARRAN